jgi:hypothetical protein
MKDYNDLNILKTLYKYKDSNIRQEVAMAVSFDKQLSLKLGTSVPSFGLFF